MLDYRFDGDCFTLKGASIVTTEAENGYNYKSTTDSNSYITATKNSQRFFIPTTGTFTIEFDIITANQIGLYLQLNNSNYAYSKSLTNSGHIKLEYQNNTITYTVNNTVTSIEFDFEEQPVGFNITDWQNDMNITITNFKIDAIP